MSGISALAEEAIILVPVRGYLAKLLDNDRRSTHQTAASVVHGDDLVVETSEAPLVLGDERRLETAVAVARDVDPQRPFVGQHRLDGGGECVLSAAAPCA